MLDKVRLKKDADCVMVAESIGMEVRPKGKTNLILCPAHNDTHIGSCTLNGSGFYCFACGEKGDVFKLVQLFLGVSFKESLTVVANICGGESRYQTDEVVDETLGFISFAEREAIGLKDAPVYSSIAYTSDSEDVAAFLEDGYIAEEDDTGWKIKKLLSRSPLFDAYKDDNESYRRIVDSRCREKINFYHLMLDRYSLPESFCQYGFIDRNLVAMFIQDRINEVKAICDKHGNGIISYIAFAPITAFLSCWQTNEETPF